MPRKHCCEKLESSTEGIAIERAFNVLPVDIREHGPFACGRAEVRTIRAALDAAAQHELLGKGHA